MERADVPVARSKAANTVEEAKAAAAWVSFF